MAYPPCNTLPGWELGGDTCNRAVQGAAPRCVAYVRGPGCAVSSRPSASSTQLNFWHSDQCNMINGTSGQMWAPFMTPQSSLEFYSPEACR
jgi:hypothetical protein